MTQRNLTIFHCLACGAILHAEPRQAVPDCCGRPMVKAAAETVNCDDGSTGERERPSTENQPAPASAS